MKHTPGSPYFILRGLHTWIRMESDYQLKDLVPLKDKLEIALVIEKVAVHEKAFKTYVHVLIEITRGKIQDLRSL